MPTLVVTRRNLLGKPTRWVFPGGVVDRLAKGKNKGKYLGTIGELGPEVGCLADSPGQAMLGIIVAHSQLQRGQPALVQGSDGPSLLVSMDPETIMRHPELLDWATRQ